MIAPPAAAASHDAAGETVAPRLRRRAALALVLLVGCSLLACVGSEDAGSATTTVPSGSTAPERDPGAPNPDDHPPAAPGETDFAITPRVTADEDTIEELRSVVEGRLTALEPESVEAWVRNGVVIARVSGLDEGVLERIPDVLMRAGRVDFRPVLAEAASAEASADVDGDWIERFAGAGGFRAGPPAVAGEDLRDATASEGPDGRQVTVAVAGEAQTAANESIDACSEQAASCPTGQLAVVIDGTVLAAPTVNAPDLASGLIIVSLTDLSPDEAIDVAAVIVGGPLPGAVDAGPL